MPLIIASPRVASRFHPPLWAGRIPAPDRRPLAAPHAGTIARRRRTAGWGIAMVVMGFVGVPVLRVMLGLF